MVNGKICLTTKYNNNNNNNIVNYIILYLNPIQQVASSFSCIRVSKLSTHQDKVKCSPDCDVPKGWMEDDRHSHYTIYFKYIIWQYSRAHNFKVYSNVHGHYSSPSFSFCHCVLHHPKKWFKEIMLYLSKNLALAFDLIN